MKGRNEKYGGNKKLYKAGKVWLMAGLVTLAGVVLLPGNMNLLDIDVDNIDVLTKHEKSDTQREKFKSGGLTFMTSIVAAEVDTPNTPVQTPWLGSDLAKAVDLANNDTPENKAARANKSIFVSNADGSHPEVFIFDENGDKIKGTYQFGDKTIYTDPETGAMSLDDAYKYGFDTGLRVQPVSIPKIDGMVDETVRGVDASSYQALKDAGVKFYDNDGNEKPLMQIMAESGVNYMRIRIFNDPKNSNGSTYGGGNNDTAQAIKIAQEAQKYGMHIMVDFMYSDFWADPSQQVLPKAWNGLSGQQIQSNVMSFTTSVLTEFTSAGITPSMVQVGNEITNGLLSGGTTSGSSDGSTTETSWADKRTAVEMSAFLMAGSKAVRDTVPSAQVVLQLESPNLDRFRTILNAWRAYGVDYDVLASSYYPTYSDVKNNPTNLKAVQDLAAEFGKGFVVAEVAQANSPYDGDGTTNVLGDTYLADDKHPATPQGQVDVLAETYNTVLSNQNQNGLGAFYWEPAWTPVFAGYDNWWYNKEASTSQGTGWATAAAEGYLPDRNMYWVDPATGERKATWGGSSWDNAGLFDINGVALKSLDFYKDSISDAANYKVVRVDVIKLDGNNESKFYRVPVGTTQILVDGTPVVQSRLRAATPTTTQTAEISSRNVATFYEKPEGVPVDASGEPIYNSRPTATYIYYDVANNNTVVGTAPQAGVGYYTQTITNDDGTTSTKYILNSYLYRNGSNPYLNNSAVQVPSGYETAFDVAGLELVGTPEDGFNIRVPVRAQTWTTNPDDGYGYGPTTPTTPSEPVNPTAPSTPTEPVTPTSPSSPTEPVNPTTPSTSPEPVDPGTPTEPVTPTTPNAPVGPTSVTTTGVPWPSVETVTSTMPTAGGTLAYTATPVLHQSGVLPYTSAEQQQKRWLIAGATATLAIYVLGMLIDRKRHQ
ncbi:hypothetical protein FM131_07180 [Weissella confusa]|uniref:glycosyl hydrolase 53 family protein n=1 Tax=Weissella confusa TaxID=1583 RepID=UPI000989A4DD|nr:glycosyl hydrolase 53 family protein [Weissella confusa]SJX69553.1 hypothetical protein FM131_07180 [Weissella confusa]